MATPTTDELLRAAERAYAEVEATVASHLEASADRNAAGAQSAIQRMMRRLDGFARGLGLDEAATQRIVEQIVAEMPDRDDEARLDAARQRMIVASA